MGDFSHLSDNNEAAMVDVSTKTSTARTAAATGKVTVSRECAEKLSSVMVREIATTARIAGIQAAKQTSSLIPLCHPISLTKANIEISFNKETASFTLLSTASTTAPTGVEMEALCALTIAAATIYDMIKAVDPGATLGPFYVVEKKGGKSAHWLNPKIAQQLSQ